MNDNSETVQLLPLTSDIVFKQVFGQKESKPILRVFLNDVLGLDIQSAEQITLLNPIIDPKYIDDKMKQIEEDRIADAKEVLRYLTRGMRQELEEEVVVMVNTGDYTSEPQIIKKKISIKDANKCAELLGKRYSLFTEKVDLNGNVGVTIIDDIGSLEDE